MFCKKGGTENSNSSLGCSKSNIILQSINGLLSRGEKASVVILFLLWASSLLLLGAIPSLIVLVLVFFMKKNKSSEPKKSNIILQSTNNPLSGREKASVVIFFLLLASTLFFGIIPILIALIYVFIMKKHKSFKPIVKSQKYIKYYMIVVALLAVAITAELYYLSTPGFGSLQSPSLIEQIARDKKGKKRAALVAVEGSVISIIVVSFLHWLFGVLYFRILEKHQVWIIENGIFKKIGNGSDPNFDAIGQDRLKTDSTADEMTKLDELLEKGLMTQDEYDKAKAKLT